MSELKKFLTQEDIENVIANEKCTVIEGTTVTVYSITLINSAVVVGINYGSIDSKNQDWEKGKMMAKAKAMEKIWELEGYLLRQKIMEAGQ